MEGNLQIFGQTLVWHGEHEPVLVQPWGLDGIRIQATMGSQFHDFQNALSLQPLQAYDTRVELNEKQAILKNDKVLVEVALDGQLSFFNTRSGKLLLAERQSLLTIPPLVGVAQLAVGHTSWR